MVMHSLAANRVMATGLVKAGGRGGSRSRLGARRRSEGSSSGSGRPARVEAAWCWGNGSTPLKKRSWDEGSGLGKLGSWQVGGDRQ